MSYIPRPLYLNKLLASRNNGEIKIITGMRRCGKSMLLNVLYRDELIRLGTPSENIISLSFDIDDDPDGNDLTDPKTLKSFLYSRITDENTDYYVFLDEIQMVEGFERIVNGLNARENVDVYITGSNSKFLSSDINTIFRGRGDEIRVHPLSFKEFRYGRTEETTVLWKEYYTYGGLPGLWRHPTPEQKITYLKRLWDKTYLDDVVERNQIRNRGILEEIADSLCSSIGSLTNPSKILNTLKSVHRRKLSQETVAKYLQCLENAFLFSSVRRYNIKGRKYYGSVKKFYATDVGLRNARLNFRQQEITHIMENVICNELLIRGFAVDVGVYECRPTIDGKSEFRQYEVDFIATDGNEKFYIQSAYAIPDAQKRDQELFSLRRIDDSFCKVVIVGDDIASYTDDQGIVFMGLFDFLNRDRVLS